MIIPEHLTRKGRNFRVRDKGTPWKRQDCGRERPVRFSGKPRNAVSSFIQFSVKQETRVEGFILLFLELETAFPASFCSPWSKKRASKAFFDPFLSKKRRFRLHLALREGRNATRRLLFVFREARNAVSSSILLSGKVETCVSSPILSSEKPETAFLASISFSVREGTRREAIKARKRSENLSVAAVVGAFASNATLWAMVVGAPLRGATPHTGKTPLREGARLGDSRLLPCRVAFGANAPTSLLRRRAGANAPTSSPSGIRLLHSG